MRGYVNQLVENLFHHTPLHIADLGGGFYGKVYSAQLDECTQVVIKFHLYANKAQQEKEQLETLKKVSLYKIPSVLYLHRSDHDIPYDAIIMEYLDGLNGGQVLPPSDLLKKQVADEVVDGLLTFHACVHKEGFGEINGLKFEKDWRDYYKRKVDSIYSKATELHKKKWISEEEMAGIEQAYQKYWEIFCYPIETAVLIHGDYNMWNIMLSEDWHVTAVIDPYGCCYGDNEYDLYQLNNANGKDYGLLERYKAKKETSPNFDIKLAFYEVFTEIMHYYDANVKPYAKLFETQCAELEKQMQRFLIQ